MSKKKYHVIGNGAIWKNKYKKAENEPFFKGKATIMGNEVEVAGWFKNSKDGKDMISLSFSEIEEYDEPKKTIKQREESLQDIFGVNNGKR